ncbi:MAG: phosphatase PAP2 family protein [Limisphaerales bacterium]
MFVVLRPVLRSDAGSDLIAVWNDLTLGAIRHANVPPPAAVRQLAIVHLAVYDTANGIDRRYQPYAVEEGVGREGSMEAAVSMAAHHCLRALLPKSSDEADSHLRAILAAIPNGPAKSNGMDWGRRVAAEILRLRQLDGAGRSVRFVYDGGPGFWVRTPPNYDQPMLPNWGSMKPFAIPGVEGFLPPPPPRLSSPEWIEQLSWVRRIGATNSAVRTPEQREIALFWADGPRTETPPGHWNRIAQQVAQKRSLDMIDAARLFAALNVALADAGIVCWEAKYRFNGWRPITAIRQGELDGGGAPGADSKWTPLVINPPFPEHPSGHSTFSGAGAAVLASLIGTDEFDFVTTSDGLPGVVRRFHRFSDAAAEAGVSRIYGGIHFPAANEGGLESGRKVGEFVASNWFRPIGEPMRLGDEPLQSSPSGPRPTSRKGGLEGEGRALRAIP